MAKESNKTHTHNHYHAASHGATRQLKFALILFAVVSIMARVCPLAPWLRFLLYAGIYLVVGYEVIGAAIKGLLRGEWFDENFLMTIATLGVFALALYEGSGDYGEAIAVILFFRIGEYFLGFASRRSIEKAEQCGLQINKESNSEAFITRFAKVYTPIVCLCALAVCLFPPIINICLGNEAYWGEWIYRALTFLVISCPCAMVISIPMTFFAAISGAGQHGILITDGCSLERLNRGEFPVGEIVFTDENPDTGETVRRIARKCMRIVWQNISFAIGVKILCLILSAFGYAPMWLAVFADTGIMILCVLNALRAMRA